MRKYGFGYLVCLVLMLLAGLGLNVPEARTQPGFLSDYTFGFWGNTGKTAAWAGRISSPGKAIVPPVAASSAWTRWTSGPTGSGVALPCSFPPPTPFSPRSRWPCRWPSPGRFFTRGNPWAGPKAREPGVQRHQDPVRRFHLAGQRRARHYQLITKISTGYGTAEDGTDFQVE